MMYGINWDRTKEFITQSELLHKTILLDSILENIPEMVFVKDCSNDLRFLYFNQAGKKLLGVSAEQILGKNDYDLFPKDQANFFTQKDREVFQQRQVVHVEKEPIQTPRGQRWLETYKVPTYKSDGSPHLLIGISKDITDELNFKEMIDHERSKALHASKLASLGEMSAGIAHEINNPLAIIMGNMGLLKKFKVHGLSEKWVKLNCFSDHQNVVVQVIDSGSGISETIEAKLFQPFFTTKPVGE